MLERRMLDEPPADTAVITRREVGWPERSSAGGLKEITCGVGTLSDSGLRRVRLSPKRRSRHCRGIQSEMKV